MILILCTCFPFVFSNISYAQDSKPQLAEIILNDKTNDSEALDIVKKLDPGFFAIDEEYLDGGKDAVFSARFVPLDKDNQKRFIIATVANTAFYCTAHGCPFYIYENTNNAQWKLSLSFQAYSLWHDIQTKGSQPNNLISRGAALANSQLKIWIWNGQYYILAKSKGS